MFLQEFVWTVPRRTWLRVTDAKRGERCFGVVAECVINNFLLQGAHTPDNSRLFACKTTLAFGRAVFQYVFCSPDWSISALLAILDVMPISSHLESCACKNLNQFFCCRKLLIKAIWAVNALERLFSLMAFMETHQQHMKQSREWSPCFPKRSWADQGSHGPSGASRMSLEMLNRGLNHRSFVRKACRCHTLHQVVRLQLEWKTAGLYISPDAFERPDRKKHCRMTTDLGWTCTHTHKNHIRNRSTF